MRWHRYCASNASSKSSLDASQIAPCLVSRLPPLYVVTPFTVSLEMLAKVRMEYQNPASMPPAMMIPMNLTIMNSR